MRVRRRARHGRARPSGATSRRTSKTKIKGGLEALTSGQFIALWTERVDRFMARKVEPPEHYVQLANKAKKPTKLAVTGKKKTTATDKKKKETKRRGEHNV